MAQFTIRLRIVFYYQRDKWIAHCLETDLIGDGESKEEALKRLEDATEMQLEVSIEHGNPDNFFSPADSQLFQMFFRGKHIEMPVWTFELDNVNVEGIDTRVVENGIETEVA